MPSSLGGSNNLSGLTSGSGYGGLATQEDQGLYGRYRFWAK